MGQSMVVSAWARFDDDTEVSYVPGREGDVEFAIGGESGFNLQATDGGLARLAEVVNAAVRDGRRHRSETDDDDDSTGAKGLSRSRPVMRGS